MYYNHSTCLDMLDQYLYYTWWATHWILKVYRHFIYPCQIFVVPISFIDKTGFIYLRTAQIWHTCHLFTNTNIHFRGIYLQYFDYSQRRIITNSPIITDYRSMFTFLGVEFQDYSIGTVINTTIWHYGNTLLMIGVHILGEFYFHCFDIFCFSLESYFVSSKRFGPHCVKQMNEWHPHG